MGNQLFIIRGNGKEDYAEFSERILQWIPEALLSKKPETCKISITKEAPPKLSVIPFRKDKIALITITGGTFPWKDVFQNIEGFSGGYRAETALPVSYAKDWADGVDTPGIGLLTLFRKKPGISYGTFINQWHNSHTPLSLRIHPLWNYVRNVITEGFGDGHDHFDAIVEEHVRIRENLLRPSIFFGGMLKMPKHMLEVWKDINKFIDRSSMECYLTTEYHIKSKEPSLTPDISK